jgi:hypothetical protein
VACRRRRLSFLLWALERFETHCRRSICLRVDEGVRLLGMLRGGGYRTSVEDGSQSAAEEVMDTPTGAWAWTSALAAGSSLQQCAVLNGRGKGDSDSARLTEKAASLAKRRMGITRWQYVICTDCMHIVRNLYKQQPAGRICKSRCVPRCTFSFYLPPARPAEDLPPIPSKQALPNPA